MRLEIAGQLPGEAKRLGVRLDVTGRQSTDEAIGRIEQEFGPVDVLVNNAGISSVTPFAQITDAEWTRLFEVNLRGVLVVTQRVLTSMVERRSGRIINISSMAGKEGLPNLAHYCATKFGVIGLTQSLAKEVAGLQRHRQRSLPRRGPHPAVGPPGHRDPARPRRRERLGRVRRRHPARPPAVGARTSGTPAPILASDAAANITGEALNVSGGQQMH